MGVRIRPVRSEEWEKVRDLRLEALKDTPIAFGERYEDAVRLSADEWRARTARSVQGQSTTKWVAEAADGRWVGTMTGYRDGTRDGWVLAVYVAPDFRGRAAGVADRLLDAVLDWGRNEARVARLVLEVREDNEAARRFYTRRGFAETGNVQPYPLDPAFKEIEMSLQLS
jgi:ribosomal protein S18 acetylase RimI-like enzyme